MNITVGDLFVYNFFLFSCGFKIPGCYWGMKDNIIIRMASEYIEVDKVFIYDEESSMENNYESEEVEFIKENF